MRIPFSSSKRRLCVSALTLAVATLVAACGGGDPDSQVYSETNATANSIVHMGAGTDGALTVLNTVSTGGAGTNTGPDPLSSQNSVIATPDRKTLFAVNAGDNSVSAFSIDRRTGDLKLLKNNPTTGDKPVSLAYGDGYLYVLFQGSQTIQAYAVKDGVLGTSLGSWTVDNAVGKPTQITLSPGGKYLLVNAGTASNAVDSFPVKSDGSLGTAVANTSDISSPFASVFLNPLTVLVTNAADHSLQSLGFLNGKLSYRFAPVVGDAAGAPCWLVVTPDGRFAYTGNGATGSISSYALSLLGKPRLLKAQAAADSTAVAGDSWISADGRFLYTAYLEEGYVVSYAIGLDGSLKKVGQPAVVTPGNTMQGLAGVS